VGKRSDFERRKHDKYMTTDPRPVELLQPHLPRCAKYAEPCAGKGDLIASMAFYGHTCTYAGDVKPQRKWIERRDAMTLDKRWRRGSSADLFVTNPPWTRSLLHALIDHLPNVLPTWLLLDADWMHTQQAAEYLDRCSLVVSVGRVKWMENMLTGVDNSAWYFFPGEHSGGPRLIGLAR
jgi:hypothetical protein